MEMIRLENVVKQYQESYVLNQVSLSIDAGEVVAIVGPSGGGKTTLLRVIAGLEQVDQGTILIEGNALVSEGKYVSRKQRNQVTMPIGYVFQQLNLFPHLSVLKNLLLSPHILKRGSIESLEQKAKKLLEFFGLERIENRMIETLSGGEKQRIGIVRALMLDPTILLFDEPTSALDPARVQDFIELILKLKSNQRTIVVVTHDMAFARAIATKILSMDTLSKG